MKSLSISKLKNYIKIAHPVVVENSHPSQIPQIILIDSFIQGIVKTNPQTKSNPISKFQIFKAILWINNLFTKDRIYSLFAKTKVGLFLKKTLIIVLFLRSKIKRRRIVSRFIKIKVVNIGICKESRKGIVLNSPLFKTCLKFFPFFI